MPARRNVKRKVPPRPARIIKESWIIGRLKRDGILDKKEVTTGQIQMWAPKRGLTPARLEKILINKGIKIIRNM